MDDVALFAIGVMQQRNVRAAIGVVFNGRDFRGHSDFVAPEVHLAVLLLVATAAMPDHDFAVIVAAAGALFRLQQSLLRLLLGDVALVQDGDEPPRRRVWIKAFQSHRCLLPLTSSPFRASGTEKLDVNRFTFTDSPRTRSSFRLPPISRRLSSSRGGSLRFDRDGASCRENSRCAPHPP